MGIQSTRWKMAFASRKTKGSRRHLASKLQRVLRIEPLEDRCMLATILVDTAGDTIDFYDGVTSLREAVFAANIVPGRDEIRFDFGHDGPETIVLVNGEIKITSSLAITGPGAELLTIDASGNDPTPDNNNGDGSRIFNIYSNRLRAGSARSFQVSITGTTLTGGDIGANRDSWVGTDAGKGGAIFSSQSLILDSVSIVENAANGSGGGVSIVDDYIANTEVYVFNSDISRNSSYATHSSGGGMSIEIDYRTGKVVIDNTTFSDNRLSGSWSNGGGLSLEMERGTARVTDSTFSGNAAEGTWAHGGGAYAKIRLAGDLTFTGNRVLSNTAAGKWGRGGGVFADISGTVTASFSDNRVRDNVASGTWSNGGGIAVETNSALLEITNNRIEGNLTTGNSARGGGISVEFDQRVEAVALRRNHLTKNEATVGGGIYIEAGRGTNALVRIEESMINQNLARSHGGGMYFESFNGDGHLTLLGSVVVDNTARGDAGGGFSSGDIAIVNSTLSSNVSQGRGGGLLAFGSSVLQSSTIVGNVAGRSGGGAHLSGYQAVHSIHSTVIANNTASPQSPDLAGGLGISGRIEIAHSLISDGAGSGLIETGSSTTDEHGNLVGGVLHGVLDAGLGPLADNGGWTKTHALLPGSLLLDRGDPLFSPLLFEPPLLNDQRGTGFSRVVDGANNGTGARIDIGAYESQRVPTGFPNGDYNQNGITNAAHYTVWRDSMGSTTDLRADGNTDGAVDQLDYELWGQSFGNSAVPVPKFADNNSLARTTTNSKLSDSDESIPDEIFALFFASDVASMPTTDRFVLSANRFGPTDRALPVVTNNDLLLLLAWNVVADESRKDLVDFRWNNTEESDSAKSLEPVLHELDPSVTSQERSSRDGTPHILGIHPNRRTAKSSSYEKT